MGTFLKIFCLACFLPFLIALRLFVPTLCIGVELSSCPQFKNPAYTKAIQFYSYRLKDIVSRYGCNAIAVYYAFGDENGAILDLAEEDDSLITSLINILKDNNKLASILAANKTLTQALGNLLLDESSRNNFLEWVKNLNANSLQALSEKNPAIVALAILIPNADPKMISKGLSAQETVTLMNLVDLCAMTSAVGEATGMENLLPYFTTNPNDALSVYKDVIKAWGNNNLSKAILKTPGNITAIVPPLGMNEMQGIVQTQFTAKQFHEMQKLYINIIRDIYLAAKNKYSAAWAGEICADFADSLALALLTASPEEATRIRKFLLSLVENSKLFRKLFLTTGCYQENNLNLLGRTINMAGFLASEPGNKIAPLTALANWYADGRLSVMLEDWLPLTTAEKFSVSLHNYLDGSLEEDTSADAVFIEDMIRLAMFRNNLADEQKMIFDDLCSQLIKQSNHPALALAFLHEIKIPLFNVLQPGKFNHSLDVAMHLVDYGYPQSGDPTLFEYFIDGKSQGYMPMVGEAIYERGALPESRLLAHGQTFADRHGGYSVGDMIDAADTAITVGSTIVAAVGTLGAATPAVAVAIARVGAKQAARQIAKRVVRNIGKKALKASTILRQVAKQPGTYITKGLKTAYKKPKEVLSKAWNAYDDVDVAMDGIKTTKIIFGALTSGAAWSLWDDPANSTEREYICPRDIEEKEDAVE